MSKLERTSSRGSCRSPPGRSARSAQSLDTGLAAALAQPAAAPRAGAPRRVDLGGLARAAAGGARGARAGVARRRDLVGRRSWPPSSGSRERFVRADARNALLQAGDLAARVASRAARGGLVAHRPAVPSRRRAFMSAAAVEPLVRFAFPSPGGRARAARGPRRGVPRRRRRGRRDRARALPSLRASARRRPGAPRPRRALWPRRRSRRPGWSDRIEMRDQRVEELDDEEAFDLAWLALPFLPATVAGGSGPGRAPGAAPWRLAARRDDGSPRPRGPRRRAGGVPQRALGRWPARARGRRATATPHAGFVRRRGDAAHARRASLRCTRGGRSVAARPAQISAAPPSSTALGRSPSAIAALAMPKIGTSSAKGVTEAAEWRLSIVIQIPKPRSVLGPTTNSSAVTPAGSMPDMAAPISPGPSKRKESAEQRERRDQARPDQQGEPVRRLGEAGEDVATPQARAAATISTNGRIGALAARSTPIAARPAKAMRRRPAGRGAGAP